MMTFAWEQVQVGLSRASLLLFLFTYKVFNNKTLYKIEINNKFYVIVV